MLVVGNHQMAGMTDGEIFAALGRITVAEAVVTITHQPLGLQLSTMYAVAEHLAIRTRCQQVIVARRNPCTRHAAVVDTKSATATCRLREGLKDAGIKEVATVIASKEVGGISQHITQLLVAGLIDGISL